MGCPVIHWEFWSTDPKKVSAFYTKVFDWDVRHLEEMQYNLVETGAEDGIDGGIVMPKKGPWPGNMTLYIDVDDLEKYCSRIKAAGGKVLVERMHVPGAGDFSLFEDPDGRVLGIWKQLEEE